MSAKCGFGTRRSAESDGCMQIARNRGYDDETVARIKDEYDLQIIDDVLPDQPVNVLMETGGAREWHAQELGMDVDPGSLQRWRFYPENNPEGEKPGFAQMEKLPLASMADPESLTDFIRWGVQEYPAKK